MSLAKISIALETHLNALSPALQTALENKKFTPTTGTPYQRVNLLPATPDNSSQGQHHYREIGLMQVMLCYPVGNGRANAIARAELLRTHFKRGLTLTNETLQVIITQTPAIGGAFIDNDWYMVPVSIYYQSDIFI